MRIAIAFRIFFAVLFRAEMAERVARILNGPPETENLALKQTETGHTHGQSPTQPAGTRPANAPDRNDALTLLSVLQRDARLLDLIYESLDQYTDQQIGSAARNVLIDTHKSLDRMLGIRAAADVAEGERIEVPEGASPIRWRIVGNANQSAGTVTHPGWIATRLELPKWTGSREEALVVSPVEVEA